MTVTIYPASVQSSSLDSLPASAGQSKGGLGPTRAQAVLASDPPKKSPLASYLDTIELNRLPTKSLELQKRVDRYGRGRSKTLKIATYLEQAGETKTANRLKACGNYLLFHHYERIDLLRLIKAHFCKAHLICVLCAMRRGGKLSVAYAEKLGEIMKYWPGIRPQMLTLTVKNGPDLEERTNHLFESRKKLWKRGVNSNRKGFQSEAGKILGAVSAYETTNKGKGWHPHLHEIILSERGLSKEHLRDEWKICTKDSFEIELVDLQDPDNPVKDCLEVWKVLRKKRLLRSYGIFRGVPDLEKLTDDPLLNESYTELLFKFYSEKGCYSLERLTHKEPKPEPTDSGGSKGAGAN